MKLENNIPTVGTSVLYRGILSVVTFNPFDRNDESVGFLYHRPDGIWFWRPYMPCDEYEVKNKLQ